MGERKQVIYKIFQKTATCCYPQLHGTLQSNNRQLKAGTNQRPHGNTWASNAMVSVWPSFYWSSTKKTYRKVLFRDSCIWKKDQTAKAVCCLCKTKDCAQIVKQDCVSQSIIKNYISRQIPETQTNGTATEWCKIKYDVTEITYLKILTKYLRFTVIL